MITIGVDAHKTVHAAVAIDEAGQEIAQWRGPNSVAGWQRLLEWARSQGTPRQWGIEGAWNYGRGLAQHLVQTDEHVYEVNARWTALGRRAARRTGKTDRLDARAVALFVRQEAPDLPAVHVEDESAVLDLLTSEREAALVEAVRLRNQIHALLMQIDPEYKEHLPALDSQAGVRALSDYTASRPGLIHQERAASVRRLAQRLRLAIDQAADVGQQIAARTEEAGFSPLTELYGVNLLTAGTLAGILGPGQRFHSDAGLAAHAGVAPLEASSAGAVRHRLNRGGNRRLNGILHRIAITQLRGWQPAQEYMARRVSEGKSKREAIRALKRYLARAVWHLWRKCAAVQLGIQPSTAA